MRIVIVGCGKVGTTLVSRLQEEGHEITVIDHNERVIEQISNTVDVIGYVGNGAVYSVLESAEVRGSDLLLAVTQDDEIRRKIQFAKGRSSQNVRGQSIGLQGLRQRVCVHGR